MRYCQVFYRFLLIWIKKTYLKKSRGVETNSVTVLLHYR